MKRMHYFQKTGMVGERLVQVRMTLSGTAEGPVIIRMKIEKPVILIAQYVTVLHAS